MHTSFPRALRLLSLLLLPGLALAHEGHDHHAGFWAGLAHPFSGLDHLLGIMAAGILLGALPSRARWLTAIGFVALTGAAHALWTPAASDTEFFAGLVTITAVLVAAGMAATRLVRLTAAALRSRT